MTVSVNHALTLLVKLRASAAQLILLGPVGRPDWPHAAWFDDLADPRIGTHALPAPGKTALALLERGWARAHYVKIMPSETVRKEASYLPRAAELRHLAPTQLFVLSLSQAGRVILRERGMRERVQAARYDRADAVRWVLAPPPDIFADNHMDAFQVAHFLEEDARMHYPKRAGVYQCYPEMTFSEVMDLPRFEWPKPQQPPRDSALSRAPKRTSRRSAAATPMRGGPK
jgi:hypothetical protein